MTQNAKITIIGSGAWGTALAEVLVKDGRDVTLYARTPDVAATINSTQKNPTYLPGVTLHEKLKATSSLAETLNDVALILMVVPAQFMRTSLEQMKPLLSPAVPVINCAKGIEIESGQLLSDVFRDVLPQNPYAVLSGPAFAGEVAKGLPTAITLASTHNEKSVQDWAKILHTKTFRPYLSKDPVGAEIAGAVKNVIAIACGIVEGRALGQNAKAAILTRGLAEISRLGLAKGAKMETFMGLSGLGDLTLTCHSMTSRNFSLGHALGLDEKLADILAKRKSVTEGVTTAKAVVKMAERLSIDMPICKAIHAILQEKISIGDVIDGLLSRDLKSEHD